MSVEQNKVDPISNIEAVKTPEGGVEIIQIQGGENPLIQKTMYFSLTEAYDDLKFDKTFENVIKWGHVVAASGVLYWGTRNVYNALSTDDPIAKALYIGSAAACSALCYLNITGIGESVKRKNVVEVKLDKLRNIINGEDKRASQ